MLWRENVKTRASLTQESLHLPPRGNPQNHLATCSNKEQVPTCTCSPDSTGAARLLRPYRCREELLRRTTELCCGLWGRIPLRACSQGAGTMPVLRTGCVPAATRPSFSPPICFFPLKIKKKKRRCLQNLTVSGRMPDLWSTIQAQNTLPLPQGLSRAMAPVYSALGLLSLENQGLPETTGRFNTLVCN